jgi:ABC-type spermidine/putrescine transport system, permease component I
MMQNSAKKFVFPYMLWLLLSIVLPLLLILYYAMIDKSGDFTLNNFIGVFAPQYVATFIRSFRIALVTTILCLLIGYPTALFISQIAKEKQGLVIFLFILPTWTNIVLRTYAWFTMFYKGGTIDTLLSGLGLNIQLQYSTFAVYIGMVYNFLPFMILPLYTAISKIGSEYLEASEDLGASKLQRIWHIIIPQSMPGIASGIIMVFLPAATTFVIPQMLSGGKYNLIGNTIERQFQQALNMNFGSALSLILICITIISIFLLNTFDSRTKGGKRHEK